MNKKQELAIHIGFWAIFFGMDIYFDWISERDFSDLWHILQCISFSFLQMIIFYLNYAWICKLTIPKKKWGWLILGQFFLIILFSILRHLLEEVLIYNITGIHNYNVKSLLTPYYFYDNSFYAIRILLFSLVFYFIKSTWNTQQKLNELSLQKKQAEIKNLRSQLSPHFLFNILNSFYADLMDTNPKVSDDILKLSEMLRYVTYESEKEYVSIKDEILFLQHYIELYSRRFDHQLHIDFNVSVQNDMAQVPALLLIPFVENALKHGISTDMKHPIVIDLKTEADRLNFEVSNQYKKNEHYDQQGIGNQNVALRLDLLYPKNHQFLISKTENSYRVLLQIPISS